MRYCICGAPIPRRKKKGGQEKQYCSDRCRQRACRTRNKDKHDIEKIVKAASERLWTKMDQEIHRETWQDDLEQKEDLIEHQERVLLGLIDELEFVRDQNKVLQRAITHLEEKVTEREAEIVRLNVLLDAQAKRKSR